MYTSEPAFAKTRKYVRGLTPEQWESYEILKQQIKAQKKSFAVQMDLAKGRLGSLVPKNKELLRRSAPAIKELAKSKEGFPYAFEMLENLTDFIPPKSQTGELLLKTLDFCAKKAFLRRDRNLALELKRLYVIKFENQRESPSSIAPRARRAFSPTQRPQSPAPA